MEHQKPTVGRWTTAGLQASTHGQNQRKKATQSEGGKLTNLMATLDALSAFHGCFLCSQVAMIPPVSQWIQFSRDPDSFRYG